MQAGRGAYDLAYGCFSFCGLTALALGLTRASYTDTEWAGGAGGLLLLFLPVILAACAAMLVGIALGIRLWRHWPLAALAAVSALFIAQSVTEYGAPPFQKAVPIAYGAAASAMSGAWFLVRRWRR